MRTIASTWRANIDTHALVDNALRKLDKRINAEVKSTRNFVTRLKEDDINQQAKATLRNTTIDPGRQSVTIKTGKTKMVRGSFLVENGTVASMLYHPLGKRCGSCIVSKGDVIFIPEGFYAHALTTATLVSCDPEKQQYDNFILDQMTFTSRLKTYRSKQNVAWLLRRLDAVAPAFGFMLSRTALAPVLGISREMVGRAVSGMMCEGSLVHIRKTASYKVVK